MNLRPTDIQIKIKLMKQTQLDTQTLVRTLSAIESALHESDREDVKRAGEALGLPQIAIDASVERLRAYRNQRFLITDAKPGSLEIIGLVAGVSYWVLQKTVGEALGDAFKETEAYVELREFFRVTIDGKSQFIARSVHRRLRKPTAEIDVESKPRSANMPNQIDVRVYDQERSEVTSLGEQIDGEQRWQ